MRGMIFCNRCGNYAADGLDNCPKCTANLAQSGHSTLVGGIIQPAVSPSRQSAAGMAAGAMFGSSSSEPAGIGGRFVAIVIDQVLLIIILAVSGAALVFVGGTAGSLISLVVSLAVIAYEPYFIASKGATPGKSAMGLRVIGKDGGPVSGGQSVARFVLKIIFNSLVIPIFIPLFAEKHRALHDMVAGTLVVRA